MILWFAWSDGKVAWVEVVLIYLLSLAFGLIGAVSGSVSFELAVAALYWSLILQFYGVNRLEMKDYSKTI